MKKQMTIIIYFVLVFSFLIPFKSKAESVFLSERLKWDLNLSDVENIYEIDFYNHVLSDDRHSLSSCRIIKKEDDDFLGDVFCYFLDDELSCIGYILDGYQDPNCDIYFDEILNERYGQPLLNTTNTIVESLIIWECFADAVEHMYIVWDVMEQYKYDVWDISDDTVAIVLKSDSNAVAMVANKERTNILRDWFAYRGRVYEYEHKDDGTQMIPEVLD